MKLSDVSMEVLRDALRDSERELDRLGGKPCRDAAIVWYDEWLHKCALQRDIKKLDKEGEQS